MPWLRREAVRTAADTRSWHFRQPSRWFSTRSSPALRSPPSRNARTSFSWRQPEDIATPSVARVYHLATRPGTAGPEPLPGHDPAQRVGAGQAGVRNVGGMAADSGRKTGVDREHIDGRWRSRKRRRYTGRVAAEMSPGVVVRCPLRTAEPALAREAVGIAAALPVRKQRQPAGLYRPRRRRPIDRAAQVEEALLRRLPATVCKLVKNFVVGALEEDVLPAAARARDRRRAHHRAAEV